MKYIKVVLIQGSLSVGCEGVVSSEVRPASSCGGSTVITNLLHYHQALPGEELISCLQFIFLELFIPGI